MGIIKGRILNDKKVSICSCVGILFSILGLIMYVVTAQNTTKELEVMIMAASIAGTLLAIVSVLFIYMDGALSIISAALYMFSMLMFLSSQGDNLGYALAGISDIGYGIQGTLIIGEIFYLVAVISEAIAIFGKTSEIYSAEKIAAEKK